MAEAEAPCVRNAEARRRSGAAEARTMAAPRGHSVRVLARIRPSLPHEEETVVPCLRPIGSAQLEVLQEPRAHLTDGRSRRRTIGGLPNAGNCRSADALSETARPGGWFDMPSPLAAAGASGLRELESRTFSFDKVFDATVTDDQVFQELQEELQAALAGEAVSILAYGATGSGKTHTVTNFAERAAMRLDEEAETLEKEGLRLDVVVQIVEIYNEQFRDLLVPDVAHPPEPPRLKMPTPTSSATLQGASQRQISRGSGSMLRSLQAALRAGQSHRATCSTAVHGCSSRSHLVMMLYLVTSDATTGAQRRLGRLSLVDLAGSERIKSSEATGDRLREAQHINRSLSALADVIVAKEKGGGHVPYRNSKLTHLLQDALGGQQNSRTAIVVALPPTWSSLGETLHSLQLSSRLNSIAAQRSRQTSLVWPLASVADEEAFAMARHEADRLRLENAQMRARLLQLEERDKERERELLELKQKVEAGLLLQASLESRRTFCSSPPSPVPEADSSQEKSFAESEKAVAALETSATSPLPDGLQPEPELQPADDFDELTRGSLEARALDFTGSFADVGFTDTGTSERPAEEEGPEQNWKWADPKDTSLQLQFLPSPVRSRRSSVAGEEGASQLQDASDSQVEEKQDPATAEEVAADRNGGDSAATSITKRKVVVPSLSATERAKASQPRAAPPQRSRSASCKSPREYIVEAITPAEAEKLTKSALLSWSRPLVPGGTAVAPLPDTWLGDDDFLTAQTDFVMLSEVHGLSDSDASPRSEGHISDSSDEAQIKDRLKALLRHRRPVAASSVRAAGGPPAVRPQGPSSRAPRAGSAQTPRVAVATAGQPMRTPRDRSVQAPSRAETSGQPARAAREGVQSLPRAAAVRTAPSKGTTAQNRPTAPRVAVSAAPAAPLPATPRSVRAAPVETVPNKTSPPTRAVSASPGGPGHVLAFSGIQRAPARHSLQSVRRHPASPMGSTTAAWSGETRSPVSPSFSLPRTPRLRQPYVAPSLLSGARVVAGGRMGA